jgi:tetratricopeptide (TPR) repeat protein
LLSEVQLLSSELTLNSVANYSPARRDRSACERSSGMKALSILTLVVTVADLACAQNGTRTCKQLNDEILADVAEAKLAHAESAALTIDDRMCAGVIFNNIATVMNREGRWAEAEKFAQRSVQVLETVLAPDDPILLPPYHLLSANRLNQNKIAKSREAFRRILQIRVETPKDRLLVHGVGAPLLRAEGKLRDAESEYLLALEAAREAGLSEAPDGAIVLSGLGSLYIEQNRFTDARGALEQANKILATRKDAHPVEYRELLLARAMLCTRQGCWRDAEQDLHECLDIARRNPPDADLMASILNWYASVLRKTHHGREAHTVEAQAAALRGHSESKAVVDVSELAYAAHQKKPTGTAAK